MNSGLYAACAGLVARTQALDLAAHNLANLNTNGYKAQVVAFRSLLPEAGNTTVSDGISTAVHAFGAVQNASTNLTQGTLEHTGSDLDFALQGEGWFVVQGYSKRLYTRNGSFHIDGTGHLVTAGGNAVLGAQGPIRVPPGKMSVSTNGTISVDGAVAGQLKLVQFPSGTTLTAAGDSYYSTDAGAEKSSGATVVQGSLEASNVNAIASAVGLVALQRNAEFLQQALTAFHSNFNRIAAQDLSRI